MFGEKLCCHFKFTLKKVIISPRFIIYDIFHYKIENVNGFKNQVKFYILEKDFFTSFIIKHTFEFMRQIELSNRELSSIYSLPFTVIRMFFSICRLMNKLKSFENKVGHNDEEL